MRLEVYVDRLCSLLIILLLGIPSKKGEKNPNCAFIQFEALKNFHHYQSQEVKLISWNSGGFTDHIRSSVTPLSTRSTGVNIPLVTGLLFPLRLGFTFAIDMASPFDLLLSAVEQVAIGSDCKTSGGSSAVAARRRSLEQQRLKRKQLNKVRT